MEPGDLLAKGGIEGNILQRIEDLESLVQELLRREVEAGAASDIFDDLGEFTRGRFISGDVTVDQGDGTTTATFAGSGGIFDGDGIFVDSTTKAIYIAVSSGVVTWYVTVDGLVYAGAGQVKLDNTGLSFFADADTNPGRIKWYALSPTINTGQIVTFPDGSPTPNRSTLMRLYAQAESGGTGKGRIQLLSGGSGNQGLLTVESGSTGKNIYFNGDGTTGYEVYPPHGDRDGYTIMPDDTNENTAYTYTVKAQTLWTHGYIRLFFKVHTTNGATATAWTATVRIKWNGATVLTGTALTLSANANRHAQGFYEVCVQNRGSQSSQWITMNEEYVVNSPTATLSGGDTTLSKMYGVADTVNTGNDVVLAVTIQKSNNNANFDVEMIGVWQDGPYYAA